MTGEKEFGAALYELAHEEKKEDEVLAGLVTIQNAFADSIEYLKLLSNPAIPKSERLELIEKAFANAADRYAISFVKILCERGELSALVACIKEYTELLYAARGILPVTAESASALTPEQEERLCDKLHAATGKNIQLSCRVIPSLLGGVRLIYSGKQLDGSVQNRLHTLKTALLS